MRAIHTKHIPSTDTKGARIKAYVSDGRSVMIPIDYDLDDVGRHFKAAKLCIEKHFQYASDHSSMAYGDSADGKGYVFCFLNSTVK